jgi:hypothetical protein
MSPRQERRKLIGNRFSIPEIAPTKKRKVFQFPNYRNKTRVDTGRIDGFRQ